MKKKIIITLSTIIVLIVLPISVFAAMNWRGSDNVSNIKSNLSLISQKMDDLSTGNTNKDKTIKEVQELLKQQENLVKQKENELKNKQQEIQQKIDEINEKNRVIDGKNAEINTKEQELQQALQDVQEIDRLTEELAR